MVKSSGTIDATHLESYWKFMVLTANRSKYSNDLADVILDFMNIYYGFNFNCQGQNIDEIVNNSSILKIYPNPIYPYDLLKIETQNKQQRRHGNRRAAVTPRRDL